ncbi:hypothetical protein MCBRY_000691 [Methylocystis bryophila]
MDWRWLMGRFTGYVGLMSLLDSRLTANERAVARAPIFSIIEKITSAKTAGEAPL